MSALLWASGVALLFAALTSAHLSGRMAESDGDYSLKVLRVATGFVILGALCWRFA